MINSSRVLLMVYKSILIYPAVLLVVVIVNLTLGIKRKMKTAITLILILFSVSACSDFNSESYYSLSGESVNEIIIDFTSINGDYHSTSRYVLADKVMISDFLCVFKDTEINQLTRLTTRNTTSRAEVTIKYENDEFLWFDVGLINEEEGYIQFLRRGNGYFKVYGEKPATKFAKYLFSLVEPR
tara:strand:+ start:114072 stop:114623 length:552 start_codon:yes stop_codon:yes gene_type:complete